MDTERGKDPKQWIPRKGESRQKAINITGSIIVALAVAALIGGWKMLMDIRATVNKADVNTKMIEKTSRVTHSRISKNHEKIEEICEMAIRADEKSRINERRIDLMEIRTR